MHTVADPIAELIDFEKSIQRIDVKHPVKIRFSADGKNLCLDHGDMQLQGRVNRPFMHQLGSRAWGRANSYAEIERLWGKKFSTDRVELESELTNVFKENDLIIKYFHGASGINTIYGVVSPHFIEVNQLEFRHQFLESLGCDSPLKPISTGITVSDYGQVAEVFDFNDQGLQTKYRYILVYARNNGYEAYQVNWGREVVVCTNGLTTWKGSKFKWKHTRETDLKDFISLTVNEGVANQHFIEGRIKESRETLLQPVRLKELLERLSVARATKQRITNRLAIEAGEIGGNEWALSQAFTWLGSHEKHIPIKVRSQFVRLGTNILEKSLHDTLNDQVIAGPSGHYGVLLPPELRQPAHA